MNVMRANELIRQGVSFETFVKEYFADVRDQRRLQLERAKVTCEPQEYHLETCQELYDEMDEYQFNAESNIFGCKTGFLFRIKPQPCPTYPNYLLVGTKDDECAFFAFEYPKGLGRDERAQLREYVRKHLIALGHEEMTKGFLSTWL